MLRIALALLLLLLLAPQKQVTSNPKLASSETACQNVPVTPNEESVVIGNVAIRRALNGNIVIIADSSSGGAKRPPDGIPDLVFRFAPLKEDIYRHPAVSFNLKQAQIFFQHGRLAVVSKDSRVVASLSVEETEKDDLKFSTYGDQSRDLPDAVRLTRGIGLVRQVPVLNEQPSKLATPEKSSNPSRLPALIDLETEIVIRRGGAQTFEEAATNCTAGGQGAQSCSINCPNGNGCSVSCGVGVGYWACSNCPNNCKCIEEGLQE
jgi:hypothetical protein